jgi:hypothetical protein
MLPHAGYAAGFFPGAFAVAFGSDYHMDIIPCDVVAAVTIAAAAKSSAAHGSTAADEVPIYHACSAHSHPLPLGEVFSCAAKFWTDNPPPLCLPATRWGRCLGEGECGLRDCVTTAGASVDYVAASQYCCHCASLCTQSNRLALQQRRTLSYHHNQHTINSIPHCAACVCRYPVFSRPHKASEWGIWLGRCIAWAKIMGIGTLLQAVGKTREATLLKNAYTAFSVYNTPRYDRSILSAVDNVVTLRVRADELMDCVWLKLLPAGSSTAGQGCLAVSWDAPINMSRVCAAVLLYHVCSVCLGQRLLVLLPWSKQCPSILQAELTPLTSCPLSLSSSYIFLRLVCCSLPPPPPPQCRLSCPQRSAPCGPWWLMLQCWTGGHTATPCLQVCVPVCLHRCLV